MNILYFILIIMYQLFMLFSPFTIYLRQVHKENSTYEFQYTRFSLDIIYYFICFNFVTNQQNNLFLFQIFKQTINTHLFSLCSSSVHSIRMAAEKLIQVIYSSQLDLNFYIIFKDKKLLMEIILVSSGILLEVLFGSLKLENHYIFVQILNPFDLGLYLWLIKKKCF